MKALIELVLIVVVAGLAYLGYTVMQAYAPEPPPKEPVEKVSYVEVQTAQAERHALVVQAEGRVVAPAELTLTPETTGRLVEVSPALQAGAVVPAGTLVARIDDADAKIALASARANVAAAEASLALEESRAEVAIADWRELNTGTPPALVARTAEQSLARAQVQVARVAVEQAELQLARTELRMPFDARVVTEQAEVGQRVDPMTVLARFERPGELEAHIALELSELGLLGLDPRGAGASDLPIELTARIGTEQRTWQAQGVRTLTDLSPTNPVITLVADIAVPEGSIAPPAGLFLEAQITGREVDAFALPSAAVGLDGRVLVMRTDPESEQHTIHWVQLDPLHRTTEWTYVATGGPLAEGAQIVTQPPSVIVDGMPVQLLEGAE